MTLATFGMTDGQTTGVDIINTGAFAAVKAGKQGHGKNGLFHDGDKSGITGQLRKSAAPIALYIPGVEGFEVAKTHMMGHNENRHNLTDCEAWLRATSIGRWTAE